MQVGCQRLLMGGKNIAGGKRFLQICEHCIGQRFRPEFHMREPRVSKHFIIIGGRYGRCKKSTPGNGYASFNKGLGNLQAMIIAGIKSGIGDEYIFGACILQFARFQCYFSNREKPHPAAFNMRIGAVAAAKRTAPFCLQVQHPAAGNIKAGV